jgi:hypothetical protein
LKKQEEENEKEIEKLKNQRNQTGEQEDVINRL